MTSGEVAFLVLVIVSFSVFGAVLCWQGMRSR